MIIAKNSALVLWDEVENIFFRVGCARVLIWIKMKSWTWKHVLHVYEFRYIHIILHCSKTSIYKAVHTPIIKLHLCIFL